MEAQVANSKREPSIRYNLAWQTASNLGVAGVGGIYLLYMGRTLGAAGFGLYALVTGVATFAFAAIDLRAHEATVKWASDWRKTPDEAERSIRSLFAADAVGRSLVWLLLIISAPAVGTWLLHDRSKTSLMLVAGFGAFLSKLGNNSALGTLRALGRFDWQGGILIGAWLLKLLLAAILLSAYHIGVLGLVTLNYGCDSAGNLTTIIKAISELRKRGLWTKTILSARPRLAPNLRQFVFHAVGISISDSLLRELDTVIVGATLPLATVGVYRMAKNIATLVWRGLDPVGSVLMPEFSRLAATFNYNRIIAIGLRATVFLLAVVVVALIAGAILLPIAVPLILGPGFADVPAATLIMLSGLLVGAPLLWVYALWVAAGRLGMQLVANATSATVACVLFLSLTPLFGLKGAAASFAVAISLPFVLSLGLWKLAGERHTK
ncbi:MAG TPA: lipopolysaccharide biosynthesis protein [Steroidobacteraceae bacterium]|nr:lipopolysaccharide biosynthesis protein [Steroidobacteraceae bacterium]